MRSGILVSLLLASAAPAFAQGYGESPYLFGVHETGGEHHMAEKGKKGWILFTEGIGRNPAETNGKDFRPWADQGYGIIVRINHGYGPTTGTLPYDYHYDDFAQRVANYVAASPGAHIWIIGNETNLPGEWPRYDGPEQPITVDRYVSCFVKCRNRIKALPGHGGDQVIPAPAATWAAVIGMGWVEYQTAIYNALGNGGFDAIGIHTYTHGSDPNLIYSTAKMNPPYQNRHYHFHAYRDYMNAIPTWARSLPVYITETDQNDPWADVNSGWVRNAYGDINWWNQQPGNQKIRALILYRWPRLDQWYIDGKWGVINDWRQAMDNNYRWTTETNPPPPPPPPPGGGLPDVIVESISTIPSSPTVGEQVVFQATVRNIGTGATPDGTAIGVGYAVDGQGGYWGSVPGPLAPGATVTVGTNSGLWTAASAGTVTLTATVDDVNRFAESDEGNNTASTSLTVGSVPSPTLPDVVVDSIWTDPASPLPGGAVTIYCSVRNAGGASTPGGVVIGVGYTVDGQGGYWGSVPGPLAPGATVTVGTNSGLWTPATAGTVTITATADDVNRFAESDEGNNSASTSVTVGTASSPALPDVVVDSVWTVPASPQPGEAVTFFCSVLNVGGAPTPAGVVIGVGYAVDGQGGYWGVVPGPLGPGESVTVGTDSVLWAAPAAGTYAISAGADDVNRFQESDEGNNANAGSVTVGSAVVSPSPPPAGGAAAPRTKGSGGSCGALGPEFVFLALGVGFVSRRLRPRSSTARRGASPGSVRSPDRS